MGLSLLAPAFLGALALIAVPVWVHLQRRHQSRVVPFPSLMFLRDIERASVRRQRLRNVSLLIVRCLVVAALAFAFSRPLLEGDGVAASDLGGGTERVILLDRSYSMGYGDHWQRALAAARAEIEASGPVDRATLVVFDERAEALTESSGDADVLRSALSAAAPGPRGTTLTPAAKLARKQLAESRLPHRELVVISDLQSLAWDRGEQLTLPRGTEVRLVDVADSGEDDNVSVGGLLLDREESGERQRLTAQVRVTRRGGEDSVALPVVLEIDGREIERKSVRLAGSGSELVAFGPFSIPPGPARARIFVPPDALPIDDEVLFSVTRGQTVSVLLAAADRTGAPDSGLFVAEALALSRDPAFEIRRRRPGAWTEDLASADVVILSDVGVEPARAAALRRFVEEGGGLLVALGGRSGPTVGALAEAGLLPVGSSSVVGGPGGSVARLSFVDRQYPGLEPFAGPRTGDFGAARFFRYYRLVPDDEQDRVLARFENGDAALLGRMVGRGRVMTWASTLDTYWNNFALQPVFLPMLHQLVKGLAGFRPPAPFHVVGDAIEVASLLPSRQSEREISLAPPDGAAAAEGAVVELDQQGFWEIRSDREPIGTLAVNVDTRESDLSRLDGEELQAALAGEGGTAQAEVGTEEILPAERERSQGLWRWVLLAGLGLLLGEMLLAGRLTTA